VRRGAAWPTKRPSSCPVLRQASCALAGGLSAEPTGAAERRRHRPQQHGPASSGRPLGVVAQHVRMPAVPCHPVRVLGQRPRVRVQCPLWASSVHACTLHARVSSVRCGRLVSSVRCPV
jgi:hypothetical protein